ncbi:MAG: peptidoglycan-binding protein, partial [Streptosporangiaceae bacterium]
MKTAAGEPAAGAALSAQAGRGHAVGWRWAAAGAVLVAAGGIAAGATGAFGGPAPPAAGLAGNAYHTATATVIRRSLSAQTKVTATLGDAGAYTVVNQAQGTLTAVPAVGQVVREGQVLYQVSGSPVVLLPGAVPAYRSLSEGMTGADVTELNAALVTLGYATRAELDPHSDYFSAETGYALGRLQLRLGLPQTGVLALGQAVFLPATARITALAASTVLGGPATPGTSLLTASSTAPLVTIDLDAAQQTEVKAGQPVTITLPGNQDTPGVVS